MMMFCNSFEEYNLMMPVCNLVIIELFCKTNIEEKKGKENANHSV